MFLTDPVAGVSSYSYSNYSPTSNYPQSSVYDSGSMYSGAGSYHSSSLARPLPVGPETTYTGYSGSLGRRTLDSILSKPPLPDYRSSTGMYRSGTSSSHYPNPYRNPTSRNWYDSSYTQSRAAIPRSASVDRFKNSIIKHKYDKYDDDKTSIYSRSTNRASPDPVNNLTWRMERQSPMGQRRAPVVRFTDQSDSAYSSDSPRSRVIPIKIEHEDRQWSYRNGKHSEEIRDEFGGLPRSNGLYRSKDSAASMPHVTLESSRTSSPSLHHLSSSSLLSRGAKTRSSSSSMDSGGSSESRGSASVGLRGLANLGNTCFMNSMLQCLSNTTPLVQYVLQTRDTNNNTSRMKGQLFRAFADLMQEEWRKEGNGVYLSPDNLKSQIQKFAPRFSGYNQQDSQEFLRYILQGLHEDINRIEGKVCPLPPIDDSLSDISKADEAWRRYLRYDDSKIVDLFVGQYKSELRCTYCEHVSTTFDPFWDLSLPIPTNSMRRGSNVTLNDCFNLFTREEILDANERPKCEKCKTHRRCGKRITIQKFPQILVIHLKRFSGERFRSRLSTLVDFPLTNLNLKSFASSTSAAGSMYNCYAVSNHSGTQTMGHYTAYAKHNPTNKWYLYDDSRVSSVDERPIVSCDAYVLFYEAANVSSL